MIISASSPLESLAASAIAFGAGVLSAALMAVYIVHLKNSLGDLQANLTEVDHRSTHGGDTPPTAFR